MFQKCANKYNTGQLNNIFKVSDHRRQNNISGNNNFKSHEQNFSKMFTNVIKCVPLTNHLCKCFKHCIHNYHKTCTFHGKSYHSNK